MKRITGVNKNYMSIAVSVLTTEINNLNDSDTFPFDDKQNG